MAVVRVARNLSTSDFFDGTAEGVFRLLRCRPHGHVSAPQAQQCGSCGSTDLEPVPAAGTGKLVSWAVGHPKAVPGGPVPDPEVVAIVELDEGPWWWSTLLDADPGRLHVGDRVRIDYVRPDDSETIPVFRLA
jgi:uncharacterized OB-fold protein